MSSPSIRRVLRAVRARTGAIGSIVRVRTDQPTIVLTYDDGPEPGGTDAVLTALHDGGATATFFVLLTRARRYPTLLSEVVAAGHEVALHGPDHCSLTGFPYREVLRRSRDAAAELEDMVGTRVRWIRPPYGRQTVRSWHAVRRAGLSPVMWSASTWDSRDIQDEARLLAAARAEHGDILLAHDGFAGPADGVDDGPEPVVDRGALAQQVLAEFRERGLVGRSLGDAMVAGTPTHVAWFKR